MRTGDAACLIASVLLSASASFAEQPSSGEVYVPQFSGITKENAACASAITGLALTPLVSTTGNVIFDVNGKLFGFVDSIACSGNRLDLRNLVLVSKTRSPDNRMGSAMKADKITIWGVKADGCDENVIAMNAESPRWFSWNDSVGFEGELNYELIKNDKGDEVRVKTMSHMRADELIWSPSPERECALNGRFSVTSPDVMLSGDGGYAADSVTGDLRAFFSPDLARRNNERIHLAADVINASTRDLTGLETARAETLKFSGEMTPESALPAAYLLSKYANEFAFRSTDDTLISRVFPADLANTLHFSQGSFRLTAPHAVTTPGFYFSQANGFGFGDVQLSSISTSADVIMNLSGGAGELGLSLRMAGIGETQTTAAFKTQMFNKDMLSAISRGVIDVRGKTGFGLTDVRMSVKDEGLSDAFMSLMRSSPATWVSTNLSDGTVMWSRIASWLASLNASEPKTIYVSMKKPNLMSDGFFMRMSETGTVTTE